MASRFTAIDGPVETPFVHANETYAFRIAIKVSDRRRNKRSSEPSAPERPPNVERRAGAAVRSTGWLCDCRRGAGNPRPNRTTDKNVIIAAILTSGMGTVQRVEFTSAFLHFPVPHIPVINSPAGFMTGTWRTGKWGRASRFNSIDCPEPPPVHANETCVFA
jgi:hypothetical protein